MEEDRRVITQEDIDAFSGDGTTALDYSYWVEDKIMTEGKDRLVENVLGLVGEAGEVAEKVKKMLRDDSRINQKEIVKELGDVLFYTTAIANYFYSDLQTVIETNIKKLDDRETRGVLSGNGDNR
tara:strand:- start:291 stop:665 length:375 start_codon:yes stop_codon:yes gene_type:complete